MYSMAKVCLYMYKVHLCIAFKYVNLILRKEKYILGRSGSYFLGFVGEAELILGI